MSFRHGTKVTGVFNGDPRKLSDVGVVSEFLRRLVSEIGMTALGYHIYDVPMAVKRLGQTPLHDEGGVTGVVVLSTSHIAIHTWPEDSGGRIDVDSCRVFDRTAVARMIERHFASDSIELHDVSFAFAGIDTHHRV